MSESFDSFVTREQARALLGGVSVFTLKRWEKAGKLPPVTRLSYKVCGWLKSQIDAVLRAMTTGTPA